jgi:CRP-like cAMP-binding protein
MSKEITAEFSSKFQSFACELEASDLNRFLAVTSLIEAPAGRKLIKAELPVDFIYMTLSGHLDVFAESKGQVLKVNEVGPGQWLGEMSVLSGDGRATASVATATDVRLLRMKPRAFEDLITGDGALALQMLRYLVLLMAGRLANLSEVLAKLAGEKLSAGKMPTLDTAAEAGPDRVNYWPECRPGDMSANFKSFLRALPGVENFPPADFDKLFRAIKLTMYPAGHVFALQGQRGDFAFLVVNGAVALRHHNPLFNAVTEKTLNVGEWFALLSLANGLTESDTVTAVKPVYVASLSRDDFNQLFDESHAIAHFVLYMLVKELARKAQTIFSSIQQAS